MVENSTSVDEIWRSLKNSEHASSHEEYKKRSKQTKSQHGGSNKMILEEKIVSKKKSSKKSGGAGGAGGEKKTKKKENESKDIESLEEREELVVNSEEKKPIKITVQEYLQKIARDLNMLESTTLGDRKRSIELIWRQLSEEYTFTLLEYNELLNEMARPIFKRFADTAEKIRDFAFKLTKLFFERASDFVPILGYFIPALLKRIPTTLAYDQDLQIFVSDIESHQAYKRGRAVERQDKTDPAAAIPVIESSEEIRLLMCQALGSLCARLTELQALSVINPYFSDVILYLQAQVRDPFPEVKIEAFHQIEFLAGQLEYENGMCYFSVALCRCILPHLRHRHARVRSAAVDAYRACVHIPNRAKRKGAGTETITELIGFREENVLPVAAFYRSEVSINYLAELSSDPSATVRERIVHMLTTFLTELEDRYDHQTRLLPYLLDLLGDEIPSIQQQALACLSTCGVQYEQDHPDDIIEKRQFGIDGDDRCNFEKPFPFPFTQRPRIGVRLYVRGNTKRFLFSLISELTNWQNKTRIKSAKLLKYLLILCEEHLTMESNKLIPAYIKALTFSREDKDKELEELMLEICEISGRYVAPESYVHFILPRLRGDAEIFQFGVDSMTRCCVMDTLRCMIDGSKSSLLPPLFIELVTCLVDPFVIDIESLPVHQTALQLLNTLLSKIQGKGVKIVESLYDATGRFGSLPTGTADAFKFLFLSLRKSELQEIASNGLKLLSGLNYDTRLTGVDGLISRQMPVIVNEITTCPDVTDPSSPLFQLFELFLVSPWFTVQSNLKYILQSFDYIAGGIKRIPKPQAKIQSPLIENSTSMAITVSSSSSSSTSSTSTSSPLLEYYHLLHAAMSPIFSSTVPLSKYYLHLYPLKKDEEVGDTKETEDYFITTERSLHPTDFSPTDWSQLYELLIATSVWNTNDISLEIIQMDVLSLFLCQNITRDEGILVFIRDLFDGDVTCRLLLHVIPNSAAPNSPLILRKKSIEFLADLVYCCYSEAPVIPFQRRVNNSSSSTRYHSDDVKVATKVLNLIFDHLLFTGLNDSSDDIQRTSLEIMLYLIPNLEKEMRIPTPQSSSSSSLEQFKCGAYFAPVIDCLLNHCVNGNPTEEIFTYLDLVLRSVAILDPVSFETTIRAKFTSLTSGDTNKLPSPTITSFFSGLIDHSDVLIQFQQLKMSK